MSNESNLVPFKEGEDPRRNKNGRPKGSKNFSTIIRELGKEDFNWDKFPKHSNELKDFVEKSIPIGSPLRAIVYRALLDAVVGKGIERASAREWLRKAGYGDKLDLTSKGKRILKEPAIIPDIKPRDNVETQEEAGDSSTSS